LAAAFLRQIDVRDSAVAVFRVPDRLRMANQ